VVATRCCLATKACKILDILIDYSVIVQADIEAMAGLHLLLQSCLAICL